MKAISCAILTLLWLGSMAQTAVFYRKPVNFQLYPRDNSDSASVTFSGQVLKAGCDSIGVSVIKNKKGKLTAVQSLSYQNAFADFELRPRIHAELTEYGFSVQVYKNGKADTVLTVDSVVAGDVFLINGQSNSHPSDYLANYKNEFCRSFGVQTTNANWDAYNAVDTLWGMANGDGLGNVFCGPLLTGVWGIKLQELIKTNQKVPTAIINGGMGGSPIEYLLRDGNDPENLASSYGRMLYRTKKAGLDQYAKAMFFYQGEGNSDYNSTLTYAANFDSLYRSWQIDYPAIEKVYVVQIHHGCGYDRQAEIREIQRGFAKTYSNVVMMAPHLLPGHDGCHYAKSGYDQLAEFLYRQVARDFYGSKDTVGINPPDLIRAYYVNGKKNKIRLEFTPNQTLQWGADTLNATLGDYFYFDANYGIVQSYNLYKNTVTLNLNQSISATTITYLPNVYYNNTTTIFEGPYLYNTRGVGALSFLNAPIYPYPPPAAQFTNSANAVCVGTPITFTDQSTNHPNAWSWRFPGADQPISNQQNPTVTYSNPGWYEVTLVVSNVTGTDSATKTNLIYISDGPNLAVNATQLSVCYGEKIQLKADSALAYVWSPGTGLSDSLSSSPIFTATASVNYTVYGFDSIGCSQSKTVQINVIPIPSANAGISQKVCAGDLVQLHGTGGTTCLWQPGGLLSDSLSYSPTFQASQSGWFKLTVWNPQGCPSSDSIYVEVGHPVRVNAGNDAQMCVNDTAWLQGTPAGGTWIGKGIQSQSGQSFFTYPQGGDYDLIYALADSTNTHCVGYDTVSIHVSVSDTFYIISPTAGCPDTDIHLVTNKWMPGIQWGTYGLGKFDHDTGQFVVYHPSLKDRDSVLTFHVQVKPQHCIQTSASTEYTVWHGVDSFGVSGPYEFEWGERLVFVNSWKYIRVYQNGVLWQTVDYHNGIPSVGGRTWDSAWYEIEVEDSNGCIRRNLPEYLYIIAAGGVAEINQIEQSWQVFPNPVQTDFQVILPKAIGRLELFDVQGRPVANWPVNHTTTQCKFTEQLPAGVYFLQWQFPEGRSVKRLVMLGH